MRRLVIDLDDTLTITDAAKPYSDREPRLDVIAKLSEYRQAGFAIIVQTARSMRTFEGNVGKINVHTLPTIIEWLEKHAVPYDEVVVGKPWCGFDGFYIDDRAIRPSEFVDLSYEDICSLLGVGRE